jgi:hypothetical protein
MFDYIMHVGNGDLTVDFHSGITRISITSYIVFSMPTYYMSNIGLDFSAYLIFS